MTRAQYAEFLTIDEYFRALELNVANNKKEEIFIRLRILWAYNDRVRNSLPLFTSESEIAKWRKNFDSLLNLLDTENVNDRLLIAEINRNTGNFEKCISIIDSIETPYLDWIKQAFKAECNNKNQLVFQLK